MEKTKFWILKLITKMIKALYFQYFLFYTRVLNEDQPHFTTYFALSASEGFLINAIIDIISLKYFCYNVNKWSMIVLFLIILGLNYWYFSKLGKGKEIIKKKPLFFDNRQLSIICAVLFFLISVSWLFWGPIYGKYLLENCK